uniref:CCHC-type domain-containing protein n=1 Tax=Tanacetum cinerariifolium TaxID=118510 RepID=A0A6L2LKV7_TANCI|nr:hypothetical protein [Tanacetum cinerariifolium]
MANLSEDIQCVDSDTRPPMLDRTDFASWQQRICLYCQGKENGVNILKSIDEGPLQMGMFRKTLAEGEEGAFHLGPERPRVYSDISPEEKDRYNADIRYYSRSSITLPSTSVQPHFADNTQLDLGLFPMDDLIKNLTNTLTLLTQSYKTYLPQTNNQLKTSSNTKNQTMVQDDKVVVQNVHGQQNKGQGNNARGAGATGYEGAQNRVGNANSEYFKDKMLMMQAHENKVALDEEHLMFIVGGQDNVVDEDVDEKPVQDLALNVDNVFQADDCDAFDSDVDEAPTAQTMFMANLSSADHVYDEADPSYDSNILLRQPLPYVPIASAARAPTPSSTREASPNLRSANSVRIDFIQECRRPWSLHKGYDRFQTLISQLEIHGVGVSNEDANQKFLRSLPSFWSQVALIIKTKPGLDTLSFDDLYNNLRVFERDVKGTTTSSTTTQNMAFVSGESTSSTNNINTAYSVSSLAPQLDYDDLEQINDDDMEEMNLKWQVAMISMRIKKFHKRTGRKLQFVTKDPVGFDKTKVECFNCHKVGHFARDCRAKGNKRDAGFNGNKARDNNKRPAYQEESNALVTVDGEEID